MFVYHCIKLPKITKNNIFDLKDRMDRYLSFCDKMKSMDYLRTTLRDGNLSLCHFSPIQGTRRSMSRAILVYKYNSSIVSIASWK